MRCAQNFLCIIDLDLRGDKLIRSCLRVETRTIDVAAVLCRFDNSDDGIALRVRDADDARGIDVLTRVILRVDKAHVFRGAVTYSCDK